MMIRALLLASSLTLPVAALAAEKPAAPATAPAAPPPPVVKVDKSLDPVALETARKLVAIILPPDKREQMFANAVNATMNNMVSGILQGQPGLAKAFEEKPEIKPLFAAFIERQRKLALDDIKDTMPELMIAYANAYARIFTAEDLDQIATFLATPSGTKYAQRSAEILSDPDFAAWQRNVSARSQGRLQAEITTLMTDIAAATAAKGGPQHGS